MTSHIKLYGSKSDRFEQIKENLEQTLGYEPSNPEVIGLLMAEYGTDVASNPTGVRIQQPRNART